MKTYPICKINLGLNVLRRRPDGFHDIETLFVPCEAFRDELQITPSDSLDIKILKQGGCDWDPAKDLTVKAWKLLHDDFGISPVSISLQKNIPVGAGLGGGSSDCAYTLVMLNELFSLSLSPERLAAYAARLGSDCAFFVYAALKDQSANLSSACMFAEGRGELLTPFELPQIQGYELRVQMPVGESVSTAQAYGGISPHIPQITLREALGKDVSQWRDMVKNDFETTVFALHPKIEQLKEEFYAQGAVYAAMSGSGAAVFGLFAQNVNFAG